MQYFYITHLVYYEIYLLAFPLGLKVVYYSYYTTPSPLSFSALSTAVFSNLVTVRLLLDSSCGLLRYFSKSLSIKSSRVFLGPQEDFLFFNFHSLYFSRENHIKYTNFRIQLGQMNVSRRTTELRMVFSLFIS